MAQDYIRFLLDLAIPKPDWDEAPPGQRLKIRQDILDIKSRAAKINQGTPKEEDSVRAKWHVCKHETCGGSCVELDVTEDAPGAIEVTAIKKKV